MHIVFTLCLLAGIVQSIAASVSLEVEQNKNKVQSHLMFGLFATPYANFKIDMEIKGHLYYHNSSTGGAECGPMAQPSDTPAILLVPNYSQCIMEKVLYAELANYSAVLSYTEGNSNTTISDQLINTRFPVAIIKDSVAHQLIQKYIFNPETRENESTYVTVYGSIVDGIIVVAFAFVLATFCCLCCCFWCCVCCKIRLDNRRMRRDLANMEYVQRSDATRQELLESIMRHLQTMERELGAQIPLGAAQISSIPQKPYAKATDLNEACAICVDDFEEGEMVRVLPNCSHTFHPDCIDEWLSKHSSLCPLCKANLRQPGERESRPPSLVDSLRHMVPVNEDTLSTTSTDSDSSVASTIGLLGDRNHSNYNSV